MNQMVGYHFQLLLIRGNVPNLRGRNFPHTTTGAPRLNRLSPLREVQRISSTVASTEKSETWPQSRDTVDGNQKSGEKLSSSNGTLYHY